MVQSSSFLQFEKVPSVWRKIVSGANHSRLTSMIYASGYVVNYHYGSGLDSTISRLTSLSDSSNTLESYTYLGLGTVVKRAHPQSGVDLSYIKLSGESTGDAGDQYTGLDRFGRIVDQRWINASNADVDRFRYGYDRDGNRTYKENVVNTALSEVYTYDNLNQISTYKQGTLNTGKTDVTGTPTNSQSWSTDIVGNWNSVTTNGTTQTRGTNTQNEITSVSGATTPTYDNNGNLTKDENNYRFVYDAWNRQVKIKDSSDTVITTNSFNGLNENIKVVAGSSTIDRIFSDGWQLVEEKSGSNTLDRNVWSPVYVDALVLRDRDTDANGTLDERLYPTQDANYNVTAILNTSGTVQEKYTYTPFGAVTYRDSSGSVISSSTKAWVFLHQGGQINIAGDYDFRNRVLSPTLGRWLTNDPLGFAAGDVNTYRYVANEPTNTIDPFGLEDQQNFGMGAIANPNQPPQQAPVLPWPPFPAFLTMPPPTPRPLPLFPPAFPSERVLPYPFIPGDLVSSPVHGSTAIRNGEISQTIDIEVPGPGGSGFGGKGGITIPVKEKPGGPKGDGSATFTGPNEGSVEVGVVVKKGEYPEYGVKITPPPIKGIGILHPITPIRPSIGLIINPKTGDFQIPIPNDLRDKPIVVVLQLLF